MSVPCRAAWLLLAVLAAGAGGCGSCPPAWALRPPEDPAWLYAAGRGGEVFVDADARRVALVRAARVLADRLGLDVEARLSVFESGGRLWVEAVGAAGEVHALDALELVDEARCDGDVHVLVRLPRPGP